MTCKQPMTFHSWTYWIHQAYQLTLRARLFAVQLDISSECGTNMP